MSPQSLPARRLATSASITGALRTSRRAVLAIILLAVVVSPAVHAQATPPAVNLGALVAYPTFYAHRPVAVRGRLRTAPDGRLGLEDDQGHRVLALHRGQQRPEGTVEATGELWDLGSMKQDDPRLAGLDVASIVKPGADWPRPGDMFVLVVARTAPVDDSPVSTIRSIVLEGERAVGRLVTVTGQFRGRNLFGDLPRSPGNSPSDFVLRSSEAAIWVSGLKPKGEGFEFDSDSRIDTNQWLRVTGLVREARGLLWIEGKSVELGERDLTQANAPATASVPIRAAPPPEVLFSVPVAGETEVDPSAPVRIQLSRDLERSSIDGRIRVTYVTSALPGGAARPAPEVKAELDERERVLVLRFTRPLERFSTVKVELLDGIKGTDGQPLKPWTLTYTVGG